MSLREGALLFKYSFDRVSAVAGLLVCLPLLGLVALVVLAGFGRPVLFRQRRAGLRGDPFDLLKFRTMTMGVGEDGARLTPLGTFLRSTSLDELPQLWNVARGEMSLVGPRPLLVPYLERYSPEQARRHEMKPGLTGWSQVNGRNALSWEDKLALDVWYVDHWSLALDLAILLRTPGTLIGRQGISQPGAATAHPFQGRAGRGGPATPRGVA